MNRSKINAFFKEFPFLKEHIHKEAVTGAKVARIDFGLLETTRVFDFREIFLLDRNGKRLAEVGMEVNYRFIIWKPSTWLRNWINESVGETIERLPEIANRTYYVLVSQDSLDTGEMGSRSIVLYKPPKDFTLAGWLARRKQRATAELRTAIQTIDAEAIT